MTSQAVDVGSVLYLRPEDTAQDVEEGFYARVVSVHDDQVLFEPLEVTGTIGSESILVTVAFRRQVPSEEPANTRASTWLRQGVAFFDDDAVHFGQVINTNELGVEIFSSDGVQWKARADVVCLVGPLYAMLMFDLAVPPGTWTEALIRESMARLDECLADATECPSIVDAMIAIAGLEEHSPDGVLREWRDPRSGQVRTTTTDHAMLYTYYVGGNRDVPEALRSTIGGSIVDDPADRTPRQIAVGVRSKSKRPRLQGSYLASETSFEGHEETKTDEPAFSFVDALAAATSSQPVQPSQPIHSLQSRSQTQVRQQFPAVPTTRGQPAAARQQSRLGTSTAVDQHWQYDQPSDVGSVTPAQAAATLRARLTDNHELLQLLRVATKGVTDDEDSNNRGKGIHKPGSSTRRLHEYITAPSFRGTSPHSFVLQVAASSALQCYPYPGIIVLLYHLAFGRPGLSIMHLCSVTLLECMTLQETNPVNMMDYGMHVTAPAPRKPKSWADLQDAANGLVLYCNTFTDATTASVALAIARFVSAMQSQGHWPDLHLPALVFWINGRLEAYRTLVDQRVNGGTVDPSTAVSWFTTSNPELVPLQNTMIRNEINDLQVTRKGNAGQRAPQQHQQQRTGAAAGAVNGAWTAMPPDVAAAIPKRQDQELCLRFASRRGCRVSGSSCGFGPRTRGHFVDKSLPRIVRAYIVSKFGGLSTSYVDGN